MFRLRLVELPEFQKASSILASGRQFKLVSDVEEKEHGHCVHLGSPDPHSSCNGQMARGIHLSEQWSDGWLQRDPFWWHIFGKRSFR